MCNISTYPKPNSTKTDSHPMLLMIYGASSRPTNDPTFSPLNTNEMLLERSEAGMILATMSTAALGATPSPRPTAAREKHNPGIVPIIY